MSAGMMRRMQQPDGKPYLVGINPYADAMLATIPLGEDVEVRIMRERSTPQLRMFWALLDYAAKASHWEAPERLLVALKLRLGRYDLMRMPNGQVVPVPQSISFGKMTQEKFQEFLDPALDLIFTEVIPDADRDAVLREVSE